MKCVAYLDPATGFATWPRWVRLALETGKLIPGGITGGEYFLYERGILPTLLVG